MDRKRKVQASKGVPARKKRPVAKKGHRLRTVHIGEGVPSIPVMNNELLDMVNVLLGRKDSPINHGTLSLMEVADAYYARAAELTMLLQKAEREGTITRGSAHYKFRTGELRTFMDMAKRAADLGSRRLTDEQLSFERSRLGRESR
ncbi:hypothetical protein SEA_KABOCHA_114 [Gordonia phage Kabocha]|uniref:Uncharacterized protein n=1 Tax=Gordonia phage Chidiebere TaxID=2656530 RepID=A0A649VLS8_9CAUD|nr:hypothetical protein PQD14_gp113 [Gordonia phage Chidiebere]QGJ92999.1 hypothetical protein PBI_CHIDIEBERE_113 [Gordonia phage Chidiebere]WAA19900.1 hypothetical protein SEA_KABOCHA_114 [Gordonia phage Kabocha]WAA20089.1 hypothetical protein SEA_HANEM_112 [Gordonia phage Hanem]WNM67132.1 hypothetical protein SEA_SCHOMBER_111 [Gordonia Phage Schomber]